MEKNGDKANVFQCIPPPNRRSDRSLNRSLGNLLRYLIADHTTSWDLILPHAEFIIINSVNRSTGYTPFEAVYGKRPYTLMDLTPLPLPPRPSEAGLDFSEHMKDVHAKVKRRLSHSTDSYAITANTKCKGRQFNSGDTVLVRLKP